jgi:uncharacterized protein (DUF2237 family)
MKMRHVYFAYILLCLVIAVSKVRCSTAFVFSSRHCSNINRISDVRRVGGVLCRRYKVADPSSISCTPFSRLVNGNLIRRSEKEGVGEQDEELDDDEEGEEYKPSSYNVLGTSLKPCCCNVRGTGIGTGFYRNGFCSTGDQDLGRHTVCVEVTEEFLQFSAAVGNDLSTPMPHYNFPGLKGGDRWCLCAARWVQAYQAGKAPQILLESTHEKTLSYAPLDILRQHAIDKDASDDILETLNKQREQLNRLL